VKNGLALELTKIRIRALEDHAEAREVAGSGVFLPALVTGKRVPQRREPASVFTRPIDSFEGHANNFGSAAIGAGGDELFECGLAAILGLFEMSIHFPGEHFSGDLGLARIAGFGGVKVAAAALEQLDHRSFLVAVSRIGGRAVITVLPVGVSPAVEQQPRDLEIVLLDAGA